MQRTTLSGMILGLLLVCCVGVVLATEADELRERARALRKKAAISAEQGNKDQAERLENEAVNLLDSAERQGAKARERGEQRGRPGIDKEAHHLQERLQDLRARERDLRERPGSELELADVRQQIAGTERELKQIHAHHAGQDELPPEFRAQAEKLEMATRRIHHFRVAAQNLKMADEHEISHRLMEQAAAMERDVQEFRRHLEAEMQKAHDRHEDHGPDVIQELKAEVERLRVEVKELSRKVEQR